MKRFVAAISLMLSIFTTGELYKAHAEEWTDPTNTSAKCEYSVDDALAGTKSLVVAGFIPKKASADGKKIMGIVVFHNPTSAKPDSVDALALVIVNKENPDVNQIVLLVSYHDEATHTTTSYLRRLENVKGKQVVSLCFDKTTEHVK